VEWPSNPAIEVLHERSFKSCDNKLQADMGAGRFRFGRFEFDAAGLELRREGVPVHLQSQPAQVLSFLVEHADHIVSRDNLRNAIWGDQTFVDFDGGLNFCISQIRSALQDDSTQPAYIRTVPKLGYQFIAPVHRLSSPQQEEARIGHARHAAASRRMAALLLAMAVLAVGAFLTYRFRSVQSANRAPILAVLRFDNVSTDSRLTQFSDSLTDNVVEQLTSQSSGAYRVIGNAKILRLPREQRDLQVIASSLHAGYAVLGQVQTSGAQIRILAHLIRLSDQTHIWVVRMDRPLVDPLNLESEAASKIASELSTRMSADPDKAPSFPSASH
jgi:DNA-binding winged helix-turn-helix (wHTH) protein/TolB-like protein